MKLTWLLKILSKTPNTKRQIINIVHILSSKIFDFFIKFCYLAFFLFQNGWIFYYLSGKICLTKTKYYEMSNM